MLSASWACPSSWRISIVTAVRPISCSGWRTVVSRALPADRLIGRRRHGTNAQSWTVNGNGTLTVLGDCLDVAGWGGSGTQVQIWACADSSNQQWNLP
jgi:hypothetical protein